MDTKELRRKTSLKLTPAQLALKPKSMDDFARVTNVMKSVVKIQSQFKRQAACAQVMRLAEARKTQIEQRRQAQLANPEQAVLKEFVTQLKSKNLTPEAFFRICDQAYCRRISKGAFRGAIAYIKLRLTETQIKRLELVLQENPDESNILYTEYQQALEAYDMCGEVHTVGPGSNGKGYIKHETIVMDRLIQVLHERNMTPSELFSCIDADNSGQASLEELRNMINKLKPSMKEKDLQMIQKFFSIVDKDNSGQLSRAEFLSHFDRANDMVQKQKVEVAENDDFAEAEIEEADQGMFTDAFVTVKGWFGGKKQQFANLDPIIPGYQLMSPRSKCDSAVSVLLKEMQKNRLQAKNVFSMADESRAGKVTVKKLSSNFVKLAPKIDKNLIQDALKSFGEDSVEVEETTFLTTFNMQFDQSVNNAIPNSGLNPAIDAKKKKQRPATASAIVVPNQNACNALIRKLDNAMLRQKLSPLDAFKAADKNGDKQICIDELRLSIKSLLNDSDLTPADLKMTMVAFDTNRNNFIDENEFITCITKARENAPPAQIQARVVTSPFQMDNTVSSIGAADEGQDADLDQLICRAIFSNMKKTPASLNELAENNLSILDTYWSKENVQIDEQDFIDCYVQQETQVMSKTEAQMVCKALNSDFQGAVQSALDLLLKKIQHPVSRVTPALINEVKKVSTDSKGMVSDMTLKKLFAATQFNNKDLFNTFTDVYNEITGLDLRYTDYTKMLAKVQLVKTFFVSAETLQSTQDGVNSLALAFGVWLEDSETLYSDDAFPESDQRELVFRYLATLYDAIDSSKSTEQIHSSLSSMTKMLKKISLRKWIGFLDSNKLKAVSSQNQKCLHMVKQSRLAVLPPFTDDMMPLSDCFLMVQQEIDQYRKNAKTQSNKSAPIKQNKVNKEISFSEETKSAFKQKQAEPQPQAKSVQQPAKSNYLSTRENPIIVNIEQIIGCPIEQPLMEYLDQQVVSKMEIMTVYTRLSRNVTKAMLTALFQACGAGQEKQIKISSLVSWISQEDSDQGSDHINHALRSVTALVDEPIRESLKDMIFGWENGVVKDEFLTAFENQGIKKWDLICLFYHFDVEDTMDDVIQLETMVKLISGVKGIPYVKDTGIKVAPVAQGQKSNARQPNKEFVLEAQQIANDTAAAITKKAIQWVENFKNVQAFILKGCNININIFDKKTKPAEVKEDEVHCSMSDFQVDNEVLMKTVNGLYQLQKVILDTVAVKTTILKIRDWMLTFAGDNEEGAISYLRGTLTETMASAENSKLTNANVLFLRYGFHTIKDSKGDNLFDLFDLIRITALLTERDGFNELEVDNEFGKRFMEMSSLEEDDILVFIAESVKRLEIRVHLATLVIRESKKHKAEGKEFNITDDNVWDDTRYSRIRTLIAEKLVDKKQKKMFVDLFKNKGYQLQLTYYDFCSLIKQKLQLTDIAEWMFEDFMSSLDNMGLAFIELGDVAAVLKKVGCDLGVECNQVDQSAKLKKKLAVGPEEYKLSESDYYRGLPSILNSEVAALAKAIQLSSELQKDEMFFDKDFGPQSDDDLEGKAHSMYMNGVKPQSHPDPAQVDWLRPSEYLDEGQRAQFLKGDASANEVKQGALGDCWFIGALSVLATRDELLRGQADSIPPEMKSLIDNEAAQMLSSGVYPPIFHRFRHNSIYILRFFKDSHWRYVIIDDRLPVYQGNKSLVFGKCASNDELWVPLIEKAYAKLHGCYQTLVSGFIDDGLADLTAMVCEKLQIHNRKGEFDREKEEFWEYLENMKQNGCLMGCSVTGGTEKSIRIDGVDTGIMSGHAYSLNDNFELYDEEMENPRKTHRLLRVRNPWGRGEWKGKWSDDSEQMDEFEDKLQVYIDDLEEDERFELGANDGTFLINYASFRDVYNRLFIVNDFPSDWSAVRFHCEWTAKCSGGLPIEKTPEAKKRFAQNPQFLYCADEDSELFVSLQQSDGREKSADGKYSMYPFKDRVVSAMLFLFELPAGMDRLTEYGKPEPMLKATPKVLHEISMRVKLKAGKKYVIVPSPRKAGTLGKFNLSIYTDSLQTEFDVDRLDDPTCRYGFIKEEYDKSERCVPAWKIKWCQDNLSHMIGKNDNEMSMSLSKSKTLSKKKTSKKKKGGKIQSMKTKKLAEKAKQIAAAEEQDQDDDDDDIDMN